MLLNIHNCVKLQQLILTHNYFTGNHNNISNLLLPQLLRLDLGCIYINNIDNHINSNTIQYLFSINEDINIIALCLSGNYIGDDLMLNLSDFIKKCKYLQVLRLESIQ